MCIFSCFNFSSYSSSSIHPLYPHLLPTSTASVAQGRDIITSHYQPLWSCSYDWPCPPTYLNAPHCFEPSEWITLTLSPVLSMRRWFRSKREASELLILVQHQLKKLAALNGGSHASGLWECREGGRPFVSRQDSGNLPDSLWSSALATKLQYSPSTLISYVN